MGKPASAATAAAFSNAAPAITAPPAAQLSREAARAAGRERAEAKKVAASATTADDVVATVAKAVAPRRTGRERDLVDGKGEYKLVLTNDLMEDPDNPRKTFRDIGALSESLRIDGMLQPIIARIDADGKLVVLYGHRRLRAAKLLFWTHVPVIIRYGVKDSTVLGKQLGENSHRADLDPVEEARAVRAYMRMHKIATYAEAAQKLGHSLTWVTNRIALLDLEQEDQDAVSSGEMAILAGVHKSRVKTGKTRASKNGPKDRGMAHFSDAHHLASRARARCRAKMNGGQHSPLVGMVACGRCWETVIRLDAQTSGTVVV